MTRITDHATGTPVPWRRDLLRVAVTLHEGTFSEVKISAMRNNRSLSQEIRTMVEAAVRASKKMEG